MEVAISLPVPPVFVCDTRAFLAAIAELFRCCLSVPKVTRAMIDALCLTVREINNTFVVLRTYKIAAAQTTILATQTMLNYSYEKTVSSTEEQLYFISESSGS